MATALPAITDHGPAPAGPTDAEHPLLRLRRPVRDADLEAFGDPARLRRLAHPSTPFAVQQVEARTALTPCRLPGPPIWSLNPYVGCSHACGYCYVPDVARMERANWGSYVAAKRNLPAVLESELRRKERRPVFLSSATDPYQAAEATHLVTRRCLEVLLRHGWPLRVLTRSPLIRRDVDLLGRFDALEVGLSIPTLDDAARATLEPQAPSIPVRMATLRALADAGLRPYVNVAPAYPFTTHGPREWAASLRAAGAAHVNVWPWAYLGGVSPVLARQVEGTPLAHFVEDVAERGYYERQARAIAAACRAEGLGVSTDLGGREGRGM